MMSHHKHRNTPSRHRYFLREALAMVPLFVPQLEHSDVCQAQLALESGETPVGCVFVHSNKIIGRGMNETNRARSVGCPQ